MNIKNKYIKYIDKNIKNIKEGSNIVIAGPTGSIATYLCYYLAYLKCNMIFLARNVKLANQLKSEILNKYDSINIDVYYFDYLDKNSVDDAYEILKNTKIDVFFNNIGIYQQVRKYYNGFDNILLVNHLMPYYFINNLISNENYKSCKFVIVDSISYLFKKINRKDVFGLKIKNDTLRYGITKRLLLIYGLNLKDHGVDITFTHPGVVKTKLFNTNKTSITSKIYNFFANIFLSIFMKSDKAALCFLKAIDLDNKDLNKWIGPRGFLHVWGYPNIQKLRKSVFKEKEKIVINKSDEVIQQIKDNKIL